MKTCPSCGRENVEDARFCSACGTALELVAPREERKVVTCLFCDLVGFTARAEAMDPEDVRRLLQPYHARVRSELERFGGTVEKFIGDAVMAIFGAPTAHEDDPERAVRSALAIRDVLAEEGELEIRIGITTGEALIALGARTEVGEGMASGDVINTAARIQAAARTGSILVDETTYRATERAIDYREIESIEAKGKASPVAVREALRARARVGVERVGGAALVGREQELTLLRETFSRVAREREPQLVTLVGIPGIGKSRLVYELFQTIETDASGLVYWRHGRSLPYGEGVTFWALGEIVKAQAGILESDGSERAGEKLREEVERFVPDAADAAWVERHLRPLAGLEGDDSAGDRRDEAFVAWRRFLEAIADERPLVLVFEDLHWADDVLLDFVDHLADWASGVPLLVLCTARPELLTGRSGWGGGKVNSSTMLLSPLSETETATLVHALLGRSAIEADLQARLLEHAGGNPLYAEEFTRMLLERPADAVLPESVQGMIAARLDTLPADEKQLLQEAAVIGRSFWLGALGHDPARLEDRLHSLERKEFVSRQRQSSVAGEAEYAFRHVLVRDVAYEQIPRAQRADKHRAAAEWIESLGRTEDHAELVAHHYAAALEYARAAGQDERPHAEKARYALRLAGDRSFSLNAFSQAADYYGRALGLWPEDERGELLLRYGHVLHIEQRPQRIEVLEEAAALLAGKRERAAEAHALLTDAWWHVGQLDQAFAHLERAVKLVAEAPASAEKVRVLTEASRTLAVSGDAARALTMAEEAYTTAATLGLTELAARALSTVAVAKLNLGDRSGPLADSDRSIELALSVNSVEAARSLHNKGAVLFGLGDVRGSGRFFREAVQVADRLGSMTSGRYSRGTLGWNRYSAGAWDEALEFADDFIAECESGSPSYVEFEARLGRARIGVARGSSEELVERDIRRALEVARVAKDAQAMLPSLSNAARMYVDLERLEDAWEIRGEVAGLLEAGVFEPRRQVWEVFDLVWVAETLRLTAPLGEALARANPEDPWRQAAEAILCGDFEAAATTLATMGHVDEAYAHLRAAETLFAEGRSAEADAPLRRAIALYRPLGATRYLQRAEALLAAAS